MVLHRRAFSLSEIIADHSKKVNPHFGESPKFAVTPTVARSPPVVVIAVLLLIMMPTFLAPRAVVQHNPAQDEQ
jgi:hypothetical protein